MRKMLHCHDDDYIKDLKDALAEREFWVEFGRYFGFGKLFGWTYSSAASFYRNDKVIEVDGELLKALLEFRERMK